jgi:hypothetical protein
MIKDYNRHDCLDTIVCRTLTIANSPLISPYPSPATEQKHYIIMIKDYNRHECVVTIILTF